MTDPIPLTVVGGYLGAGKTTLINRLLTGDHGRRLAVIVNDFGDEAVDEELLAPAAGGVRARANGCVCCSAVDGLASALDDIAALDPPPEHLIIEVSGVGDPWAVGQWGRTPRFALDGVVVVVDPVAIRDWADDVYVGDTVRAQLAAADIVLVSHADDASDACDGAAQWIATVTKAPVLIGTDVSLSLLLGQRGAGSEPAGPHDDHVATSFRPDPMTRAALGEWLAAAPTAVVRAKGFVTSDDGLLVGQRFGHRVEVTAAGRTTTPVMTVVCRGTELPRDVQDWCRAVDSSSDTR